MPKRYKRKTISVIKHANKMRLLLGVLLLIFTLLLIYLGAVARSKKMVSPLPSHGMIEVVKVQAMEIEVPVEVIVPRVDVDTLVGDTVDQYFKNPGQQSEMRMIMHCLLNKESSHGNNKGHGDNGKAGGPLQFHQPTWEGYRKIMMQQGYASEVGNRYNLEQAIETTVWAIKDGRAKAWGPILRWSKGMPTAHACPLPTWY